MRLYSRDMDAIARGAMFLSSGGGGSTRLAALLAKAVLGASGSIELVSPQEFTGPMAIVGLIGAPEIDDEKLPTGTDLVQAVGHLARLVGEFDAVGSSEIGGSNALFPVVVAAKLGIPLVDADTMGRSFPTITQSTVFLGESVEQRFVVFADALQRFTLIPLEDKRFVESMATSMNMLFGGVSGMAIGPLHLPRQANLVVAGTYTNALQVGRILLETESIDETFMRLRDVVNCFFFFRGKVVRLIVDEVSAPVRRVCLIQGWPSSHGYVRIDYQNEYLLLSNDGEFIAQTPQIISVLDVHTRHTVMPRELVYGREVAIFAMTAPVFWQEPNHCQFVNAQAFGYGNLVDI